MQKISFCFLNSEAIHTAEYLRIPAALHDRIAKVSLVVSPSGRQAVPHVKWQDNYTTTVTALLNVLQIHGKLDKAFIPSFEKQSKAGMMNSFEACLPRWATR